MVAFIAIGKIKDICYIKPKNHIKVTVDMGVMKNFIDHSILKYPLLYLDENYSKSEIRVLDHIFFVIGNGYDWYWGYPLLDAESNMLTYYADTDMEYFFNHKDDIYLLELNENTNSFIDKLNIDIPKMEKYSNDDKTIYIDVKNNKDALKIIEQYNSEVKKLSQKNISDRIMLIESVNDFISERYKRIDILKKFNPNIPINQFYPISDKYSAIMQLEEKGATDEVYEYAHKLLDYAEEYYKNNKTIAPYLNSDEELMKIQKIKKHLKEVKK